MLKVVDIDSYQPLSSDQFLFDNNIWMFLFCPIGNYYKKTQISYSKFLQKCLYAGSEIVIPSLVVSEFFNAYVRLDYNIWKDKPENSGKDFKNGYRKTQYYKDFVQALAPVLQNKILKSCTRISDNFHQINIDHLFTDIEHSDFNDNYYVTISEMNGYKIVSDDRDLRGLNRNVTLLTFNP